MALEEEALALEPPSAAADRLRELVGQLGDESRPSEYAFARIIDSFPYVRSMTRIEGSRIHLACAVEVGHVLRLMRPGDLLGQRRRVHHEEVGPGASGRAGSHATAQSVLQLPR